MNKPYFIMSDTQDEQMAMPIVDEDGNVEFFATYAEANDCAEQQILCRNFGYEIFCRGQGE
jgi:hypothetical protein